MDVRPIGADNANDDLTEQAVAAYVAKYATKAAETTGIVDRRIGELARFSTPEEPPRVTPLRSCRA